MAQQTASPLLALTARRVLAAAPARVFRAWTDSADLKRWFAVAAGYTTPLAEVDLRVGGRYRIGMQPPGSDQALVVTGEYLEIVPGKRLVFTWQWEGAELEPPTLVTVNFGAHEQGTELVLTHEQFSSDTERDKHATGWQGCLDHLMEILK